MSFTRRVLVGLLGPTITHGTTAHAVGMAAGRYLGTVYA